MTEALVYSVTVHSCPLELGWLTFPTLEYRPEGSRFIIKTDRGVWYRALGLKCSCKKTVTREQADDLLETGQAQHLYDRSVRCDPKRIWMQQQVQVPRVDLISRSDIERAYISDGIMSDKQKEAIQYIEEVHQLFMENRAKLIVPFQEKWHETDGLLFPFGADQRTPGGYK
jgi:hypothetical protein